MSDFALFNRGNIGGGFLGLSDSYAFVYKSLGADYSTPIYMTSKIAFTSSVDDPGFLGIPASHSGADTATFHALVNESNYFVEEKTRLSTVMRDLVGRWADTSGGLSQHSTTPAWESHKWYIIESSYDQGTAQASVISCDDDWSRSTSGRIDDEPVQSIYVGGWAPRTGFFLEGLYDAIELWVAHVKVGTTRWGNDIFEDDFSSGDLSAWTGRGYLGWTGTEGVVDATSVGSTVAPIPDYPFFTESCDAFGEIPRDHIALDGVKFKPRAPATSPVASTSHNTALDGIHFKPRDWDGSPTSPGSAHLSIDHIEFKPKKRQT